MVKRGFYKHYKGGLYFVFGEGKHTETQEKLVVYYSLHYFSFWARPVDSWNNDVKTSVAKVHVMKIVPRFKKISFWQALGLLHKKPVR